MVGDDDDDYEDINRANKKNIKESLVMYIGMSRESLWVEPIEIPVIKDTSVVFGHIGSEGGGRRRQTRKHKQRRA